MGSTTIICSLCNNGCTIQIENQDDEDLEVTGNGCMRGLAYAKEQILQKKSRDCQKSVNITKNL